MGSRISGTVVRLPVKVGDRVRAGDLLAELDPTSLDAAVEEARAEVDLAAPVLAQAESVYARRRALADAGLVTAEELEFTARDVDVAGARLDAARARLRRAEIDRGFARITAPIDGVVASISTREGETVAAGFAAPTFVTLVDLERLEVLAYVDETDIGRVELGQEAHFTVDTYGETAFAGRVVAIQPKAEVRNGVVNYVVRLDSARATSGAHVLRPEMTAHLRLVVASEEGVLTIPRPALRHRDGRVHVLVERNGAWHQQEVTTGWRSERRVEIVHGLAEGERVQLNPS